MMAGREVQDGNFPLWASASMGVHYACARRAEGVKNSGIGRPTYPSEVVVDARLLRHFLSVVAKGGSYYLRSM